MIAGMLTVASLGFASDSLLVAIERHLTRWKVKFGETNGG
jgi:ABC-type nitrate/sulfonate/bicarbonate transport system permease component